MVEPTANNSPVDLEKEAEYETEDLGLLENLIATNDTRHEEMAAASKPLVLAEKIFICLLVVSFVMAVGYFVGVSMLKHKQNDNSTNIEVRIATAESGALIPMTMSEVSGDNVKNLAVAEPLEDFEGGLNIGAVVGVIDANVPTRLQSEKLDRDADPQFTMKDFAAKVDFVLEDTASCGN